ncbi:MAG TPA: anti-sigma factor [Anaeromyxobacter sp.]|nr:anti-sigma factor [Anaeromyxobacter sp.]
MTPPTAHLTDAQAQRLVDGMLSEAEAPEAERHAATCAACQATVATYRMLARALDDLEVPDLPVDFTDGVIARIDVRERALARERKHAVAILAGVVLATVAAFAAAGAAAWAPVVASAADFLGSAAHVLRIGASFVPDVVGALRFQILVAAAALAVPLLLALSRLMVPVTRTETA